MRFPVCYRDCRIFDCRCRIPDTDPGTMYHAVTFITKRQTGNFFPLFLQHPFPFGLAFDLLLELIQGIFHHFGSFPVTGRFSLGCFFFSGSLLFLPSFLCSIIPDHLFLPKIPAVCNCLQICPFPSWLSTDTLCTKGRFGVLAAIVCKPLFYIHISCYILFIIQYICMFPTISGFSGTLLRLLHFPFFFQPFLSAFTEIQFFFLFTAGNLGICIPSGDPFFFLVPEVFFSQTIPAHLLDGFISRLILMLLQL